MTDDRYLPEGSWEEKLNEHWKRDVTLPATRILLSLGL